MLARLIASAALLLAVGCTDTCPGGVCECRDTDRCDFACAHVPCAADCASLTDCNGTCGDLCTLSCTSASGCDFACGDECDVTCRSVSTCAVDCGRDCAIDCADVSSCDVRMVDGEVSCQRAGSCNIECVLGDGTTTPALDCGGGVYRCNGC